jgi:hypothetical protein
MSKPSHRNKLPKAVRALPPFAATAVLSFALSSCDTDPDSHDTRPTTSAGPAPTPKVTISSATTNPTPATSAESPVHEEAAVPFTVNPSGPPPPDNSEAVAREISKELYDRDHFPKGVPVLGILHGTVELHDDRTDSTATYTNPIILGGDDAGTPKDITDDFLYLGIPSSTPSGQTKVQAVGFLQSGTHGPLTETVHLVDRKAPVLHGAAIYPTEVAGSPDQLIAFDMDGNGSIPSVSVTATVDK